MKILFFGDYSNLHGNLRTELQRRGHDVTLLSDGCGHMRTSSDIFLSREPGKWGAVKYLFGAMRMLPQLQGYDVVQFINPHFLKLRPGKLQYIMRQLKSSNGILGLTLCGNDHFFVKACCDGHTFRYSEFRVGSDKTRAALENPKLEEGYLLPSVEAFTENFYANIDCGLSALYEYDAAARPLLGDKLSYGGLAVDTRQIKPLPLPEGKINILVGMRSGSRLAKGMDKMLEMARRMEFEYPDRVAVTHVIDLPLDKYMEKLRESQIVLDQYYSYSPAMNALYTMALGRVSATGAAPEFYDFIGEKELRPLVAVSPFDDVEAQLRQLIERPELLQRKAQESREFVVKHNDIRNVADRYLAAWEKALAKR